MMKKIISFITLCTLNLIGMVICIATLPSSTYSSLTFQLEVEGMTNKWSSLIDTILPFIILLVYVFTSLYFHYQEKLKGKTYNKTAFEWTSLIAYLITSSYAWFKLILRHESYIGVGDILSLPTFYIVSAIVGILMIVCGRLLMGVKRGENHGFYIPIFMKDHSIWRRTNYLSGFLLLTSGILFIAGSILYETLNYDFLFYGTIGCVIFIALIIPLIYCLYLNIKKKKNEFKGN